MIAKFVDREEELEALKRVLESERFELVVVYGRRRVGKTRLILEALKGRNYVYYLAVERGNLEKFRKAASKVMSDIMYVREDWEAYFHFLKDMVVVIDEFPYLIREDKAIVSLFQRIVDTILLDTRTKLLLVGSSISMMKDKVLSYKSPLYGRRTGQIKLKPLKFKYLKEFYPKASPRELVEIYGFAGGVPYYLEKVETPFWEWLDRELKDPKSFLKEEGHFLLRYEFEDIGTYMRILEAIAGGKTRLGEIKSFARKGSITQYLKNLAEIEIIEHVKPVTGGRGIYKIKDHFLRFWFRYIYPNLTEIELGLYSADNIRNSYDSYLGEVYEEIALEFVAEEVKRGKLPAFTKIGKWWHKEDEIDIVCLHGKEKGLFVEVKWSDLTDHEATKIYENLVAKSRRFKVKDKKYAIICRNYSGKKIGEARIYTLSDILR